MATRYIGDLKITLVDYDPPGRHDGRWYYKGTVSIGKHSWKFDTLGTGVGGIRGAGGSDSDVAYDEMAASAVGFATYYTPDNRGSDTPDWAPPGAVARAFEDAAWDSGENGGYYVRRSKSRETRFGPYGA